MDQNCSIIGPLLEAAVNTSHVTDQLSPTPLGALMFSLLSWSATTSPPALLFQSKSWECYLAAPWSEIPRE